MRAASAAPRRVPGPVHSLDLRTDPLQRQKGDLRPEAPGRGEGETAGGLGSQRESRRPAPWHEAKRALGAPRGCPAEPADARPGRRRSSADCPIRARGRGSPSRSHFPRARSPGLRQARAKFRSVAAHGNVSSWPDRIPDQQSPGSLGTSGQVPRIDRARYGRFRRFAKVMSAVRLCYQTR